jgi:hypothetical protein
MELAGIGRSEQKAAQAFDIASLFCVVHSVFGSGNWQIGAPVTAIFRSVKGKHHGQAH